MTYHQPSNIRINSELELCVREILSFIKPDADDTYKRENVINELTRTIQTDKSLIGCVVRPFGSFVSNLYTRWGDLDISIDLSQSTSLPFSRQRKKSALQKIMWALQRSGVANNIEFVRQARVPLVVYQSKYYNISCDISINNYAGYIKSRILGLICGIDERFREFVLLIKEFAKAQQLNDPKGGTLNSYSLCLLIIFHFQTCRPAIFPPLKDLYEGSIVADLEGHTMSHIQDSFAAEVARYRSQIYRQRNQSSICQLLISFLEKFAGLDTMASNYVISTYTGQWKPINISNRLLWKQQNLLIEDPFEQTENAARAVGSRGLVEISQTFANMHGQLSSCSVPMDRASLLNSLVRPEIRSKFARARQFPTYADRTQQPRGYLASPGSSQHHYVAR